MDFVALIQSLSEPFCEECGDTYSTKRKALGYLTCLVCGEKQARKRKFAIVPMHKSNYIPVFNREILTGINSKQTRNG